MVCKDIECNDAVNKDDDSKDAIDDTNDNNFNNTNDIIKAKRVKVLIGEESKIQKLILEEPPKSVMTMETPFSLSVVWEKAFCKLRKKVMKVMVRAITKLTTITKFRHPTRMLTTTKTSKKHPQKRTRTKRPKTELALNRTR